jgi:hypothetical protein
LFFCPKPSNFGVEAHIEAPTGVALTHFNHSCVKKKHIHVW